MRESERVEILRNVIAAQGLLSIVELMGVSCATEAA
jgi:hypothetical protein